MIKSPGKVTLWIGSILALSWGGFSVYSGAKNNNQNEFYDFTTGAWDLPYTLIWLLSPLLIWLLTYAIGYASFKFYKNYK